MSDACKMQQNLLFQVETWNLNIHHHFSVHFHFYMYDPLSGYEPNNALHILLSVHSQ